MPEDIEMLDFEAFRKRYENVLVEEYPNNVREVVPEPVVSVHLLTYNHVDYIEEAIESVLMQEVDFPMEIVIGDDESTDGTREICIEYAEQHPDKIRLMLHRRENNIELHGRPTHLFQYWYNTLSLRGKYIASVSGDDYWTDPLKLQKQVAFLDANPKYSYCYHRFQRLYSDPSSPDESTLTSPHKESWAAPAAMMARNIFDRVPKVCTKVLHEDTLSKRMLELHGKRELMEDISPSVYRMHESSIYGGKEKAEKRFMLFHSNVVMLPFFISTSVETHIRRTVRKTAATLTTALWADQVMRIPTVISAGARNGAMREVVAGILQGTLRHLRRQVYAGARVVLPKQVYDSVKAAVLS